MSANRPKLVDEIPDGDGHSLSYDDNLPREVGELNLRDNPWIKQFNQSLSVVDVNVEFSYLSLCSCVRS